MIIRLEGPPERFVNLNDVRFIEDGPTAEVVRVYWREPADAIGDRHPKEFKGQDRERLLTVLRKLSFKG